MTTQFTREVFETHRDTLESAISSALTAAVADAGEDIRFIPWFTAAADFHAAVATATESSADVEMAA